MPRFTNTAVFFNNVHKARGGGNPHVAKTAEFVKAYHGNDIKWTKLVYQMFKTKGGGGEGRGSQ